MILILSSPSGAGKTTLTRMLMQDKALDLTLSVSVTTRPRRSSEVDGIHYRFIDRREFERMKKGGELLEWAEVHGNGYGSPRALVEKVLGEGRDMLFDVDWQGARQMRERLGDDVVSIFVLPPSMRELRARLERRAEDFAGTIDQRLEAARHEIERWRAYQYVVVNDDLQRAFGDVVAIVAAERLKVSRVEAGDRAVRRGPGPRVRPRAPTRIAEFSAALAGPPNKIRGLDPTLASTRKRRRRRGLERRPRFSGRRRSKPASSQVARPPERLVLGRIRICMGRPGQATSGNSALRLYARAAFA